MAFTAAPVFVQTPRRYAAAIVAGDASAWKLIHTGFPGIGAGPNGTKIVSLSATSTDTSARDVQLAYARQAVVTMTSATPGVVSWPGHMFSNGNQVIFTTTGALPTNVVAGTTYFVIASNIAAGTFEIAATFGGAAIDMLAGTQSGVQTGYVVRPITTVSVPITAGTVSTAPSANLLNSTNTPGFPIDNDGQSYLFLESIDWLAVSATATVTAAKIIVVTGVGADF